MAGFDEVAEFQATVKAMQIMGINNEDIQCKWPSLLIYFLIDTEEMKQKKSEAWLP